MEQYNSRFLENLKEKADKYAHKVYLVTRKFPKEELFGLTSQLRRSALSVPLNIIEGYARQTEKTFSHFLDISYGSLKESLYILDFAYKESLLKQDEYREISILGDEVGKMIWGARKKLKEKNEQ